MIIELENLSKSFAGKPIFDDVNIRVNEKDRVALVGKNGAGKSTLLKIMTGQLDYDSGKVAKKRGIKIGYLAQNHGLESKRTIWNEMLTVFSSLIKEEKALEKMVEQMSEENETNTDEYNKLINEYSARTEQFSEDGGYRYKSDIKGVLIGLGFNEEQFDLPIHTLSGGEKTRLAISKLLLENPDVLVLDEPTNHLDIQTLTWLETYLNNYEGAIVVVSHDRYFLDKIVTKVYDIAFKKAILYHGTYTQFLKQRSESYEREMKRYIEQQAEIKEAEEFIERNIARASTSRRAQSRRRQLAKIERIEKPIAEEARAKFSFEIAKSSGNDVLSTEDFSFTFNNEQRPIFSNVTFSIHRGERIALIGKNGIGKTTLLKAIVYDQTNFIHGTNVQIGYYSQEQETLDDTKTVLDEVWDSFPNKAEVDIRKVLGNFLFTGEDVLKPIYLLSGGEKARVSLAKLMLQQANFLILDEPTNHLDVESKEVLEEALQDYPGTILFVSHDRYFINKIAERVFELQRNGIKDYLGDYDYYLNKKEEEIARKELEEKDQQNNDKTNKSLAAQSFAERRRRQSEERTRKRKIAQLEDEIDQLEMTLTSLEEKMVEPEIFNDYEKLQKLSEQAKATKKSIDELLEQWTSLQV